MSYAGHVQAERSTTQLEMKETSNYEEALEEEMITSKIPLLKRSRSFDESVWQSVSSFKTKASSFETEELKTRPRRCSFHYQETYREAERAAEAGNIVRVLDLIGRAMGQLKIEVLQSMQEELECERIDLFFAGLPGEENMLVYHHREGWFRESLQNNRLLERCFNANERAVTDLLNEKDDRYNSQLDFFLKRSRVETLLCLPLHEGEGESYSKVIATLVCVNKLGTSSGARSFGIEDEEAAAPHVKQIEEQLMSGGRLSALRYVAEAVSGGAILIEALLNRRQSI